MKHGMLATDSKLAWGIEYRVGTNERLACFNCRNEPGCGGPGSTKALFSRSTDGKRPLGHRFKPIWPFKESGSESVSQNSTASTIVFLVRKAGVRAMNCRSKWT